MKFSIPKRIARLEEKLKPDAQITVWLHENGQVTNPHTGEVLSSEDFEAKHPDARKVTVKLWDE